MDYIKTKINNFKARPAQKEDAPLILSLIKELAAYENLEDQVTATEAILIEHLFTLKRAEVLICEYNGQAVGYALFFHNFSTFLGRSGIYLEDLYIKPQCRSMGFGREVLRLLASLALSRGCGRLEWQCLDWNKPSIKFYLNLGAEVMDEWSCYRLSGESLKKLAGE